MMKNILELLERSAERFPEKTAFSDEAVSVSYSDVLRLSKGIGSCIAESGLRNKAIAVYMNQSVHSLICMFGIVYSGNYYVVIDSKMPKERIGHILDIIKPQMLIMGAECEGRLSEYRDRCEFVSMEELLHSSINHRILSDIRREQIDTDILYVLFTSGSTGKPKGTVINHRNVLSYSKWYCDRFTINDNTVSANQTPFYFSMSVSDIYSVVRGAGTLHIIPKKLFSFPLTIFYFLNDKGVNTIYWVPSALCIVADWKALDYVQVPALKKILFAGEVMPSKQLNYWIKHFPDAMFANLFGPTETTDICCYYVIDRVIADTESVPIGIECDNCNCIVVNAEGSRASTGEEGEMYVRGSFVSMGYLNNPEATNANFVQNPTHHQYPETVYKTGDLVKFNDRGEMIYISRKDFQIKHMGYRIELGEIETAANRIDIVKISVAVYDKGEDKIILVYTGKKLDTPSFYVLLEKYLPKYMMPAEVKWIREIPYNENGKIDRLWISENYKNL